MTRRWQTRHARHGTVIMGIVIGLPLAIVALTRAVRAVLDVGALLLCVVLLREGEGPDMDGRRMKPGDRPRRVRQAGTRQRDAGATRTLSVPSKKRG